MYWWTNVAAVAGPHTRVLAPATTAVRTEYPDRLTSVAVPRFRGSDRTRRQLRRGHHHAADFFYDIARPQEQPWIATIEPDGSGLAQVSTAQLPRAASCSCGAPVPAGERWQRWLSGDDEHAIRREIQAGLAPTQYDLVALPAGATWEWTEAFGPVQVDPTAGGSDDWPSRSITSVEPSSPRWRVTSRIVTTEGAGFADRPPVEVIAIGSGSGAFERRRRPAAGEPGLDRRRRRSRHLADRYGDPVGDAARRRRPPGRGPTRVVRRRRRLGRAARRRPVRLAHRVPPGDDRPRGGRPGDRSAALRGDAQRHRDNAWARRGLAEVARAEGRTTAAADLVGQAARREPGEWRLAAEAVARLLDDGRPGDALAFVDALDGAVRARGRLRLLEGFAAVAAGDGPGRGPPCGGLEVADLAKASAASTTCGRSSTPASRAARPRLPHALTPRLRATRVIWVGSGPHPGVRPPRTLNATLPAQISEGTMTD